MSNDEFIEGQSDSITIAENIGETFTNVKRQPGPYYGTFPAVVILGQTYVEGEEEPRQTTQVFEMPDKGTAMELAEQALRTVLTEDQVKVIIDTAIMLAEENPIPAVLSQLTETFGKDRNVLSYIRSISVIDPDVKDVSVVVAGLNQNGARDHNGMLVYKADTIADARQQLIEMVGPEEADRILTSALMPGEDENTDTIVDGKVHLADSVEELKTQLKSYFDPKMVDDLLSDDFFREDPQS